MWTKLHKANLGKDPDFVSVAKPVFSVHSELARKSSSVRKEKKKRANHAPYLALYLTGFEYSSAGKHWKCLGRSWRSWSHHILLS